MIGKIAFEPGWGHYEIFGMARFFRDRVYPNARTKSVAGVENLLNNGGGIGGNLRVPTFHKTIDFGVHVLAGAGVGRYGSTTLADVTFKPDGSFEPIRGGSALGTMELHATRKMDVYFNYARITTSAYFTTTARSDTAVPVYYRRAAIPKFLQQRLALP